MPTLGNALDFAKYEGRNFRAHQLGAAPSAPVTGQLYYDTVGNQLYWYNGTTWVAASGGGSPPDATATVKGVIQLAGDLTGTAAAPVVAAGAITDTKVAAANKDGTTATASMRTLGTGALQAAAGNDARFTDSRTPLAHHTTHEPGGSDPMSVDAVVGTGSLRTLGAGAQQAMPGNRTLDAITIPAADVNLNSHKVTNLLDPTNAQDAASKNYVDNTAQGLDAKQSVRAASAGANLTLSGTQTVDGIALVAGDRVLVKDQTTTSANGIYVVASGAWTRSTDADAWTELPSAYVWVEVGTANADTAWVCTADQGGTLNTTAVTWVQFSAAGSAIAGAGLTKTGNTFDVIGTANRILVNPDSVDIASTYVGQSSITTLGTVTTGVWNGTAVPVANGGTGQTTAKAARETGLVAPGYYTNAATHGAGTTITITQATHGLRSSRGIVVQVQDNTSGAVEFPDIVVASNGDVTVTYGASLTANTKLVTLIG
jgi:hypothetical protein